MEWWEKTKKTVNHTYQKMKKKLMPRKYDVDDVLERIEKLRAETEPGSDEFRRLSKDYEQELQHKKLVKELKSSGVAWDKILAIVAMLIVAGFGFALDMDSPKGSKIASSVINIFRRT